MNFLTFLNSRGCNLSKIWKRARGLFREFHLLVSSNWLLWDRLVGTLREATFVKSMCSVITTRTGGLSVSWQSGKMGALVKHRASTINDHFDLCMFTWRLRLLLLWQGSAYWEYGSTAQFCSHASALSVGVPSHCSSPQRFLKFSNRTPRWIALCANLKSTTGFLEGVLLVSYRHAHPFSVVAADCIFSVLVKTFNFPLTQRSLYSNGVIYSLVETLFNNVLAICFLQRVRDMPLLLRRMVWELMDPQRAIPLVHRTRILFFVCLSAFFVCGSIITCVEASALLSLEQFYSSGIAELTLMRLCCKFIWLEGLLDGWISFGMCNTWSQGHLLFQGMHDVISTLTKNISVMFCWAAVKLLVCMLHAPYVFRQNGLFLNDCIATVVAHTYLPAAYGWCCAVGFASCLCLLATWCYTWRYDNLPAFQLIW